MRFSFSSFLAISNIFGIVNSVTILFYEFVDSALLSKPARDLINVCFKFFYTIELGMPLMILLFLMKHLSNCS